MSRSFNLYYCVFVALLVFLAAGSSLRGQCPQKLPKELSTSERVEHAKKLGKSSKKAIKEDIATLTAYLRDDSPEVRGAAVVSLSGILFDQKQVCSLDLVRTLLDPDADVRAFAASTVGAFEKFPDTALPLLLKAMQSDDAMVRHHVPSMFYQWGKDAQVVTALKKAMLDKNLQVRNNAGVALGKILEDPAIPVPCWLEALGMSEENKNAKKPLLDDLEGATLNWIALGAAKQFYDMSRKDPKTLAEILAKQLDHPSPLIRRIAVRQLAQ